MSGFLGGMAQAYDDQREDVSRQLREETNQRNMARMREIDRVAVATREENRRKADILRTLPEDGVMPDPTDIPMAGAGVATAASTPGLKKPGKITAPRSQPGIYDNPSLLANQTEAETQRLARMRAPGTVDPRSVSGAVSPESVLRNNSPQGQKTRADAIRKLNPAGEGVGVTPLVGGSNTDAAAIERLKATDAAIRSRPQGQYDGPTPYDDTINAAAKQHGVDPVILKRLLGTESSFNPNAVGKMTPQGQAHGIAQIMTQIHGVSPEQARDPAFAIPFAARLLAQNLQKSGGNYETALQMYKGAVSEKGKADMASPIAQIMNGQTPQFGAAVASSSPATPVGTPSQAPQQRQFAKNEFFASAPAVDEQVRLARFQMDRIKQLAQVASSPTELAQYQAKYMELQQNVREAEVFSLAAKADGDINALSQLVQLAGVPIARTAEGFVEVTPDGRQNSAPMTQGQLAQKLFQFVSVTARQQAAARSAKRYDTQLETGKLLAVEDAKNAGKMQNTELEVMGRLREALAKQGYDATKVDMQFDPATGKAFVKRGGQVLEFVPGANTPFGQSESTFKPIGGLQ